MNFTKTLLTGVVALFLTNILYSANIIIIESQSVHPLHIMDDNWQVTATNLGHTATIVSQNSLEDISNFSNADIIIIASGLIEISDTRKETLKQFAEQGGNIYIQSEYLLDLPGNQTYEYLANNLGGAFNWEGEAAGSLAPMSITGQFAMPQNEALTYFWYGTYGSGDATIQPFLQFDGHDWGFIFCSMDPSIGKIITTSDQDWIRTLNNQLLMESILNYLVNSQTISAAPTVSIESSTDDPCDTNNSMTFTATVANNLPGVELQWMINGEIVPNETGISFTSDQLLEGDVVECRLFFGALCTSYIHISNPILIAQINPIASPNLEIEATATSFCENDLPTFNAIASNIENLSNLSFQWQINGNPVNGANSTTFSPASLNNQDEVICILNYETDCTPVNSITSSSIIVNVSNSLFPQATIEADQTSICEGESITFFVNGTDLGNDPAYQWQIDGIVVGNNTPVFIADNLEAGQNISCTIHTNEVCASPAIIVSNSIEVTVNAMATPSVSIAASTTQICEGEEVIFTASGIDFGTNPSFQWQIDGQNAGTDSPVFSTTQLTNGQEVTCILTADVACAENNTVTSFPITVAVATGLIPTIVIESNTLESCEGEEVTFTASGTNHGSNPTYQWTVNGINAGSNQATFSIENLQNGQTVICYLTNPEACPGSIPVASNTISVQINELEHEILEIEFERCGNADGFIEVTGIGGLEPYTYEWMNGATENVLTGLSAGKFTVIVTDANGCQAIGQIEMENQEAPEIAEINIQEAGCDGTNGSAEITMAEESDNYTLEWFNAEGTPAAYGFQAQFLNAGVYTVHITNEHGCETTQEITIGQISDLQVMVNEDLRIDLGESSELEALVNSNDNVSYEWTPAIGLSCSDCANPSVTITESTVYTVIVTNEHGCTATDEVTIQVLPKRDVFIPNAFSPNGDGNNDFFTVFTGDNVSAIKTLRVFDRWGAEIFGKNELSPNNETEGWDGTYKGKLMDQGVYVYYVEVEYIDGKTQIHSGDISITF